MQRTILITGCSSGIGREAAIALRERGYRVIASARHPDDVARLRALGFEALTLDLNHETSIDRAVEDLLELTEGKLYALFNNGAYGQAGAIEDLPTAALREQFNSNLFGWHHLTRALLPTMLKASEGRIIQNSSVLGLVAMKYRGAYNASKFALEGYTDTLRQELTGTNVYVSLIEPGPIDTAFRASALAAFKRHVDAPKSRHWPQYQATIARLENPGPSGRFTLPASACIKPLLHALESPTPKARYGVTLPTHLLGFLRRFVPTRWMDRLLASSA